MKKIFRQIHLWISVPFGIFITLICFSGAMLAFETEIMESAHHDLYFVNEVKDKALPMEQLMRTIAETLPDSVSISGVSISSDPERAYQVNLSKPRRASIYIDQYTGQIKGMPKRAAFFSTMFRMHRWMLGSMKRGGGISWGKMIVGISTLLFVFVLISGIIIWWPRTAKALKNSLKISASKGWGRFWYDLHVAGGMYALVFLLAMALTGLTWSFEWYRNGFYTVLGIEAPKAGGHGAPQQSNGHRMKPQNAGSPEHRHEDGVRGGEHKEGRFHSPYGRWEKVYEKLVIDNPNYKQISIQKESANVSFKTLGNQRASNKYEFNPRSGEITKVSLYKDADKSSKVRGWIYSVHVGSWGGLFTRILAFLAALIGASLPLTGYFLWIKRLCRKK